MTLDQGGLAGLSNAAVSVSVSLTTYFDTNLFAVSEGLASTLDDYLMRVGPGFKWYSDAITERWKRATSDLLEVPAKRLRQQVKLDTDFSWNAHGAERSKDANELLMSAKSCGDSSDLSFVRMTFPIRSWMSDWPAYVETVKGWLERLPVRFGYAGFAFNESVESWQRHRELVKSLAPRFIGLEVEACFSTAIRVKTGIKGVNWLTMLTAEFVERLGGVDAIRRQLSEAILIHPIANGIMIQAGPAPGLGDVNAGETLPLYREVARVLRPVRVFDQPELLKFGRDGTQAWLRRFDT